jgi:hypothetical protein
MRIVWGQTPEKFFRDIQQLDQGIGVVDQAHADLAGPLGQGEHLPSGEQSVGKVPTGVDRYLLKAE